MKYSLLLSENNKGLAKKLMASSLAALDQMHSYDFL
jgi:hypothetical protein